MSVNTAWDAVLALGALFVVVTGAMTVAPALARTYRRTTIGRRRDHYRRLRRLGTNTQLTFMTDALGQPPAFRRTFTTAVTSLAGAEGDTSAAAAYLTRIALFMRELGELEPAETADGGDRGDYVEASGAPNETPEDFELVHAPVVVTEAVWVDRDYYVQALVDIEETVLAYAVTTRNRRFRPKFEGPDPPSLLERFRYARHLGFEISPRQPLFSVRLTRTRFASLDPPRAVFAVLGFRRFNYAEAHWFGNPGAYQHYVLAYNDAGSVAWPDPTLIFGEDIGTFRAGAWDPANEGGSPHDVAEFRQRSRPNTLAVVGPRFHIEDFPVSFGPDLDEIRTVD